MTTIEPSELIEDPNGWEEPEDYTVRTQLGLRPVYYTDNDGVKGSHPDGRACPVWCWVGQHPEYDHEINPRNPMMATHHYDVSVGIVASLYPGQSTSPVRGIHTATIEPTMEQKGQGRPFIKINLRSYPRGEQEYSERLRLSIADARELMIYLNHLIELTELDA